MKYSVPNSIKSGKDGSQTVPHEAFFPVLLIGPDTPLLWDSIMASDPAFLFYPGNWLKGTQLMSRAHKGAYMDILMAQFANGHLSIDDIEVVLAGDFESMWESKLKKCFVEDDKGLLYNKKLDEVMKEREKFKKGRLANLKGKKSSQVETPCEAPHEDPMCLNKDKDKDKALNKGLDKKETIDYKSIFDHYNSKGIVNHKTFTESMKKAIKKFMKDTKSDFQTCLDVIDRHHIAVNETKDREFKVKKRPFAELFGQKVYGGTELIGEQYLPGGKYFDVSPSPKQEDKKIFDFDAYQKKVISEQ